MRKYLFLFLLLLIHQAFSTEKYFIIDSSLYRIQDDQKIIVTDNVVDIFYILNRPHFIQHREQEINILTLRNVGFIPFINNRNNIHRVLSIRNIGRYVGTVIKGNIFFIATDRLLQAVSKDYKVVKKVEFKDFEAVFTYSGFIVLKNLKNGIFYIYEVDKLDQPIFTVRYSHLLQILKNNNDYFLLGLSHVYENQYELLVDFVSSNVSWQVLRKNVKVFYDSTFYLVRINSQYLLLQEKDEAILYQITDSFNLKFIKKIHSYYSYSRNGYLFTINQGNLIVYSFREGDFVPLFSIPNVSFVFYCRDKLYYLWHDSIASIWKLNSAEFRDDIVYSDEEEIVFYSLPEEVIPI